VRRWATERSRLGGCAKGEWADRTDLVQRVYETFSIYFSILNSNLNQI
jgi:hypothetical protein